VQLASERSSQIIARVWDRFTRVAMGVFVFIYAYTRIMGRLEEPIRWSPD
jgi:hypothetical protein